jgi:hypothetical protein
VSEDDQRLRDLVFCLDAVAFWHWIHERKPYWSPDVERFAYDETDPAIEVDPAGWVT